MAARWRLGLLGVTALATLGLQACVAVPVRSARPLHHNAQPMYGYGGSGYSDVDTREARDECIRTARNARGYRGVRAGAVEVTGPEHARVELRVRSPRGYGGSTLIGCSYDARTGRAFVP